MDNERLNIEMSETENNELKATKGKNGKKLLDILKTPQKIKRIGIIILCVVILLVFLNIFTPFKLLNWIGIGKLFTGEPAEITGIQEVSLERMVEIGELQTADYIHNSIAMSYDEKGKVKYYVAYKGRVTAGIDFDQIEFNVDNENKKITCAIPRAEIIDIVVDLTSLDFIFTSNKYNNENVNQEAYPLCQQDLKEKIQNEDAILQEADKSAEVIVKALIAPLIESKGYEVEYEYKEQ